jgi:hypothetical protein
MVEVSKTLDSTPKSELLTSSTTLDFHDLNLSPPYGTSKIQVTTLLV